ncbi:MAG: DUF1080 domain-containing protein [Planctomycetota bacterium]
MMHRHTSAAPRRWPATASLALALALGACSAPTPTPKPSPSAQAPAAGPTPRPQAAWRELFDGTSLTGMSPTRFGGEGDVQVRDGALELDYGNPMTGVTWTDAQLAPNDAQPGTYELEVVAARLEGMDFFCGLTFPVCRGGDPEHLTLVLGGWGGSVSGLSNLDGADAASNETRTVRGFENGRDYRIAVRVTPTRVAVEVDGEPFLHAELEGRELSLRPEVDLCRPLGLCCFATRARVRQLRWRPL